GLQDGTPPGTLLLYVRKKLQGLRDPHRISKKGK
ncbi:unnamed protein product, partial [marine sediment metagenome]